MKHWMIILLVAIMMASCTISSSMETTPPTVLPTAAATATYTPTSPPTCTPTPLPYPSLNIQTELPMSGAATELHNVIIFSSSEGRPFAVNENADKALTRLGNFEMRSLWAVSLDGRSAGRLSPNHHDFFMNLPPGGNPQLITYGFTLDHLDIETVTLPDICTQVPADQPWALCDRLSLSPNGRYLAFRYGEDNCGRSMQVIDRMTGAVILEQEGGVHGVGFLPNNYVSVSQGHCEGSTIWFYDPVSGEKTGGGGTGLSIRNPQRSINVQITSDYLGMSSSIWGYMVDSGMVFRVGDKPGRTEYDTRVMFLPGGKQFLFQHWSYAFSDPTGVIVQMDQPIQIIRYDPYSDERTVLASDPDHHYRLCQFDYENPCPQEFYGDWIQVRRLPFAAQEISVDYDWYPEFDLPCLFGNPLCDVAEESMALNTQTGEIRPWDPSSLPSVAIPQPTLTPGPDPDQKIVYSDPNGQYHFAVGNDGKSLWMVPLEGEPEQWVWSGSNFLYLP